jgi:hypothetical protein
MKDESRGTLAARPCRGQLLPAAGPSRSIKRQHAKFAMQHAEYKWLVLPSFTYTALHEEARFRVETLVLAYEVQR